MLDTNNSEISGLTTSSHTQHDDLASGANTGGGPCSVPAGLSQNPCGVVKQTMAQAGTSTGGVGGARARGRPPGGRGVNVTRVLPKAGVSC